MRNIINGFNIWITGMVLLIVWGIGRIILQVLVNIGNVWVLENNVGLGIGFIVTLIGIFGMIIYGILD